jgi:hypothetical protein
LAHAFYPRDGRVHFDEDEHFTENSTEGVNLRMMATHEIGSQFVFFLFFKSSRHFIPIYFIFFLGHAIGLEHNFEPKSIMYPEYIGYKENFSLSQFDLELAKKFFSRINF